MPYEIVGHTADLRMVVTGKNIEEMFSSALAGMMFFLEPKIPKNPRIMRRLIKVESLDKTALLVDFLNDTLALAQINKESYNEIILRNLTETKIETEIIGYKIESFGGI